jgi:hypothetical protein
MDMLKKIISVVTVLGFVLYELGCYSSSRMTPEDLANNPTDNITEVVTIYGTSVRFSERRPGKAWLEKQEGAQVEKGVITGYVESDTSGVYPIDAQKRIRIPLSDVKMVYVSRVDIVKSCLAVIGVSIAVFVVFVGIALATKESCPFIYSFDGERYVFDGEPYGGSVCQALQRTDLCRLEHLRPVDGEYRLKLTNEVNETQHTDELKLCVIDHPEGTRVVPTAEGFLHTVRHPKRPLRAVDQHGRDISRWISETDELFWETDILSKDTSALTALRDTLEVDFPRPSDQRTVKLVVSASNTLWGSQMLKRDLELWGDQVGAWYEELKNPATRQLFDTWHKREEVFHLQVRVWTAGGWVVRGEILGGGPFITEERVVPLGLEGVEGDTLKIQVMPPAGFWQLNSFAVDYSPSLPLDVREIAATSAAGHDNTDLRAILDSTDHRYYSMPEVGQTAVFVFPVPPKKQDLSRTVFAKVSGYYDIHLASVGPPQYDQRARIAFEPDYFTKFSLKEYFKWRDEQQKTTGRSR